MSSHVTHSMVAVLNEAEIILFVLKLCTLKDLWFLPSLTSSRVLMGFWGPAAPVERDLEVIKASLAALTALLALQMPVELLCGVEIESQLDLALRKESLGDVDKSSSSVTSTSISSLSLASR